MFSFPGPQPLQQIYASPPTPRHPIFSSSVRPLNTSPVSSSPPPFSLSQSSIGPSTSALSLQPSSFHFNTKPDAMASSSSSHLYWSVRDSATQTEKKQDSTPIAASMPTGTTGCRLFGIDLVNCSNKEESVPSHFIIARSRGVSSSIFGHTTTPGPTSLVVASGSHGVSGGMTRHAQISSMTPDVMVGSDVVHSCAPISVNTVQINDVVHVCGGTERASVPLDLDVADTQSKGLQINQNSAGVVIAASSDQMPPVEFPPCCHVRSCTKVCLFLLPVAYLLCEVI